MEEEKPKKELNIEEMANFCKRRGFVYPSSEIYGGFAGFYDYGPIGVELKENIKKNWWKVHVRQRMDIAGIDGTIITHPRVWEASGHTENFKDLTLECSKCGEKVKAEAFIEDQLDIPGTGMRAVEINKLVKANKLVCPSCKGKFKDSEGFNLMFTTHVGAVKGKESTGFLRPETAQIMFVNFRLIQENARLSLPFGIAQMGKAFRNEISPRNFLFRLREFEQMEIEYFIHPEKADECPYLKELEGHKVLVYSSEMQEKKEAPKEFSFEEVIKNKIIKTKWLSYWLCFEHRWFTSLGVKSENLRLRQHIKDELAHYATDCWDLEYKFPFGWREMQGMADRKDFDLQQHIKHSKKDLSLFDEETKKKIVPHVAAEPSQGVDRAFLTLMFDAYDYDEKRKNIVLHLDPEIAPVKFGVFPLVNKEKLPEKAKEIFSMLTKEFNCQYDKAGSIGRRYARQDEIGTPFCITVDFDTLKNDEVTIRERDSADQIRVSVHNLRDVARKLINKEIEFRKAGKLIIE